MRSLLMKVSKLIALYSRTGRIIMTAVGLTRARASRSFKFTKQ